MEQSPIFIPLDGIETLLEAAATPYHCGQMEIKPKKGCQLKGLRCDCLTAKYFWYSNGPGKGFTQVVDFAFEGRTSHFNYLMRMMHSHDGHFIVLLPRTIDSHIVVGWPYYDLEMVNMDPMEEMTFAMSCQYSATPFPGTKTMWWSSTATQWNWRTDYLRRRTRYDQNIQRTATMDCRPDYCFDDWLLRRPLLLAVVRQMVPGTIE